MTMMLPSTYVLTIEKDISPSILDRFTCFVFGGAAEINVFCEQLSKAATEMFGRKPRKIWKSEVSGNLYYVIYSSFAVKFFIEESELDHLLYVKSCIVYGKVIATRLVIHIKDYTPR